MMNTIYEADIASQVKASTSTTCDKCGKKLGDSWPISRNTMSAQLHVGQDESGYDQYKSHHFCGEDCMRQHLNDRHDKKSKGIAAAP